VFVSYHHSVGVGRLTDDRIHRNWSRPSARRYRSQILPFTFSALFCYSGWLVFYKGRLSCFCALLTTEYVEKQDKRVLCHRSYMSRLMSMGYITEPDRA